MFRKSNTPSRNQNAGSGVSKKSVYSGINLFLFLSCGGFALFLMMATNAISFPFFPVIIIWNLVLGYIYRIVRTFDKYWKPFRILQILTIVVTTIFFMIPLSLSWFRDSPSMYAYKKYLYSKGVYGDPAHCDPFFPEELPEVCEDYQIITQGSALAQDYHAGIYLTFRTDHATIQAYQNRIEALDHSGKFIDSSDPEFEKAFGYSGYARQKLHLEQDFSDSLVYILHTSYYYSQGCLLDEKTGTVIFWM